jgi:hypothetical protein
MKADVSTGLLGSWYFSWATRSCRKACELRLELSPVADTELVAEVAEFVVEFQVGSLYNEFEVVEVTGFVIGSSLSS